MHHSPGFLKLVNDAKSRVKQFTIEWLDRLLSENRITFIKWDMNRHVSEPGWPEKPPAEQRKLWVQYVRNLYEIIDRLRARHPQVKPVRLGAAGGFRSGAQRCGRAGRGRESDCGRLDWRRAPWKRRSQRV